MTAPYSEIVALLSAMFLLHHSRYIHEKILFSHFLPQKVHLLIDRIQNYISKQFYHRPYSSLSHSLCLIRCKILNILACLALPLHYCWLAHRNGIHVFPCSVFSSIYWKTYIFITKTFMRIYIVISALDNELNLSSLDYLRLFSLSSQLDEWGRIAALNGFELFGKRYSFSSFLRRNRGMSGR